MGDNNSFEAISCVQLYVLFTVGITVAIIFMILKPYQNLRYDNNDRKMTYLLIKLLITVHKHK